MRVYHFFLSIVLYALTDMPQNLLCYKLLSSTLWLYHLRSFQIQEWVLQVGMVETAVFMNFFLAWWTGCVIGVKLLMCQVLLNDYCLICPPTPSGSGCRSRTGNYSTRYNFLSKANPTHPSNPTCDLQMRT